MQVFIYEFVSGGGFLGRNRPPPVGLLAEGAAMRRALAVDFAQIGAVRVVTLQDRRLDAAPPAGATVVSADLATEERTAFQRLARDSDWTVVIAPEMDGCLVERCSLTVSAGGRLLGPGLELVRLASDKHATAERLAAAGVPVPEGLCLAAGDDLPADFLYPAVLKPRDGAGSLGVRLVRPWAGPDASPRPRVESCSRLERFCPGRAASVAFVCGCAGRFPLVPCRQRLRGFLPPGTDDAPFEYLGGSLPLPRPLAQRALALAGRAVAALPEPTGYLGVDLVLGPDPEGLEDVLIEVNPRLTTSYVGLRAAAAPATNLAQAMLDAVEGRVPELCFRPAAVQFDPDGTTRVEEEPQ